MPRPGLDGCEGWDPRRLPTRFESGDLTGDIGGVEPGVLVANQAVAKFEDVEDADLDRRSLPPHPRPLSLHMPAEDRFIDHVATSLGGETLDRPEDHVGDGVDDRCIDPAHLILAMEGGVGMSDVVPDDVIRIGVERGLDVVGVLCRKVPIDDVQPLSSPRSG
jgi:hypothetical protein